MNESAKQIFVVVVVLLFRVAPVAYVRSQARGWNRAIAAGLHHSHSNTGSEPCLQLTYTTYTSWQPWILNPLSEARHRACILVDASQICFLWATMGTPRDFIFLRVAWVYRKLRGRYRGFPYTSCPNALIDTPVINIPHLGKVHLLQAMNLQ